MPRPSVVLREDHGFSRTSEPIQLGIPLAKGYLQDKQPHYLKYSDGELVIPFQTRPLSYWPDNSVRWLQVAFPADLAPNQTRVVELFKEEPSLNYPNSQVVPPVQPADSEIGIRIMLPNGDFRDLEFELKDPLNTSCSVRFEKKWVVVEEGAYFSRSRSEGVFLTSTGTHLVRFFIDIQLFKVGELIRVDAGLHNPRRAVHKGGLWDLGDPGSVYFKSFSLSVRQMDSRSQWIRPQPGVEPIFSENEALILHQESSGGENWNSNNHLNQDGVVTTRYRGFRLFRESEVIDDGYRASPVAGVSGENSGTCALLSGFWQNFPSSIKADRGCVTIGLFPETAQDYELQGGERKCQTAWIQLTPAGETLLNLQSPVTPVIPAEDYANTKAFSCFSPPEDTDEVDSLIGLALSPEEGFLKKREIIDEYGWRNFGDLYADHECMYLPSDHPRFITHYNNQYDAIYGFARQFALTGDRRWFELMDDLAKHVADIDIYHTDEDRTEYNHGMFWHTDHYLDAHTATHRTYSRFNSTSSIPGQTGGGPAAEHCYSTGLLYHFWMTGSESSRSAVIELATWMRNAHEGSKGLLAQVLAVKKTDLPRLKKVLGGNTNGVYRYPFTRGTGNYINTLLDASMLEPDEGWLDLAESVIRSTIGPMDNIEERGLLDAETGWHYLVLLSAMTRYLWMKLDNNTIDEPYHYTLASLRHYWRWMVKNERPFKDDSENLEFPNDTWVAQDFRKAVLMRQAALFDTAHRKIYEEKASEWSRYVTQKLQASEERFFTRILIILLQNYGPHSFQTPIPEKGQLLSSPNTNRMALTKARSTLRVLIQIGRRIGRGLLQFRPSRESSWLKIRLER